MTKFPMKKLSELCSEILDCVNKTAPESADVTPFKMLRTSNVRNGIIDYENVKYVSEETYMKWTRRGKLKKGDIVFTREAPLGEVGMLHKADGYFLGQRLVLFRTDETCCYNRFLLYALQFHDVKESITSSGVGATVVHMRVPECANISVPCPCLSLQKKIGDTLFHYDELIENNRRQIKLLEEAAQRLYKEWFVDLRFPGHEHTPIVNGIPQGWSWGTYGDVIDFNPKVQLSRNSTYLKVPMNALSTGTAVIDMSCCERTASTGGAKFENGDTLFARITPCLENGKTGLWYSDACTQAVGSTEFIVMRSRRLNPYMVYSIARTESFRQMAQGTFVGADGRQRAQADKMQEAPCLCPSQSVIQEHQRVVEPLMQRAFLLNRQNRILSEARDRLLPKLMSGEVEV